MMIQDIGQRVSTAVRDALKDVWLQYPVPVGAAIAKYDVHLMLNGEWRYITSNDDMTAIVNWLKDNMYREVLKSDGFEVDAWRIVESTTGIVSMVNWLTKFKVPKLELTEIEYTSDNILDYMQVKMQKIKYRKNPRFRGYYNPLGRRHEAEFEEVIETETKPRELPVLLDKKNKKVYTIKRLE
jgi:hypothetical protein